MAATRTDRIVEWIERPLEACVLAREKAFTQPQNVGRRLRSTSGSLPSEAAIIGGHPISGGSNTEIPHRQSAGLNHSHMDLKRILNG